MLKENTETFHEVDKQSQERNIPLSYITDGKMAKDNTNDHAITTLEDIADEGASVIGASVEIEGAPVVGAWVEIGAAVGASVSNGICDGATVHPSGKVAFAVRFRSWPT